MKVLSDMAWCRRHNHNLFCFRATWGGYHVWERGSARLVGRGHTPALAWRDCREQMVKGIKAAGVAAVFKTKTQPKGT